MRLSLLLVFYLRCFFEEMCSSLCAAHGASRYCRYASQLLSAGGICSQAWIHSLEWALVGTRRLIAYAA